MVGDLEDEWFETTTQRARPNKNRTSRARCSVFVFAWMLLRLEAAKASVRRLEATFQFLGLTP